MTKIIDRTDTIAEATRKAVAAQPDEKPIWERYGFPTEEAFYERYPELKQQRKRKKRTAKRRPPHAAQK